MCLGDAQGMGLIAQPAAVLGWGMHLDQHACCGGGGKGWGDSSRMGLQKRFMQTVGPLPRPINVLLPVKVIPVLCRTDVVAKAPCTTDQH